MEKVGGIPKESAGVWSGWSNMGDREVVREASAKGTHLELAYKFLAHRRQWLIAEAKKYFHSEVEIWIEELLIKHQIHRASHILSNVRKEPIGYISAICVKCTDPDLRDYLARHVMSHKGFTSDQVEVWEIIECINKYKKTNKLSNCTLDGRPIESVSMDEILNLSPNILDPLLTELYFHTYEPCLTKKLKGEIVWDYLLTHQKIELIINWIDIRWGDRENSIIVDENDTKKIFVNFEITQKMIDKIDQSSVSDPLKELILNRLIQYGIFTEKEVSNMKLSLARLLSGLIAPSDFNAILSQKSCNMNINDFKEKLHSLLYYQSIPERDYSQDPFKKDKELLDILNRMKDSTINDQRNFSRAVIQTILYMSDDINEYLKNNPLITLCLIIAECEGHENMQFKDVVANPEGLILKETIITPEVIQVLLDSFPYIKDALNETPKSETVTMYQLLNGYRNLNVQKLFKWRFRGEPMPNFSSENLITKYGHKEKLTYKYYLKEARPCMAVYILQNEQGKLQDILSSKTKSQIAFQAHMFALNHLADTEIMSTCIAFIECLGTDSECLRFHITAAHYVQNKLNISINDLLKSIAHKNHKDLAVVMTHLEHSFQNEHENISINDVDTFVSVLKSWDFIVRFARLHNTTLPASFLHYLATNDLWMEFVLAGDIFEYPLEQILEYAAQFKNKNIRQHLLVSLTNSQLDEKSLTNDDQKIEGENLMSSSTQTSSSGNYGTEDLDRMDESLGYDPDLWLTILKCHQSQDPPGALLKASREYISPILIVLAACYEPSSTAAYCYSWLLISVENEELINDYIDCLDDQVWSTRRVTNLFRDIISLGCIDTLSQGIQIFMPKNPLNEFFNFLVHCLKYGKFESSRKQLIDFTNSCSQLRGNKIIDWEDTDTAYLSNEHWIATVAIECILTALGTSLPSTYFQMKFLNLLVENHFNDALNIDGPDLETLWNSVKCLASTKITVDFTAIELNDAGCTLTEVLQRCIQKLTDNEDFGTALELSKIANLPCSKIILDRCRSEFKSNLSKHGKVDASFWKQCALDITRHNVSFEDAAAFFVEHTERVTSYKERYEILELAIKTLKPVCTDQQVIDTVEMAMWKSCILAGPEAIEIYRETQSFKQLKFEILSGISNLRVSCILNDPAEEKAVGALIDRFIDNEDLETALRISAFFNYKHRDLKILLLCLSIAEGEVSPYELNHQQKMLLTPLMDTKQQKSTLQKRTLQKRHSEPSLSLSAATKNMSGNEVTDSGPSPSIQQIHLDSMALLEKLVKNLQHGFNVGNKVLLLYRLSTSLKRGYLTLLVSSDPMEILYEITGINCPRKINLINDVIAAYRLTNTAVTKFLAGEVILHITHQVEDNVDSMLMWGYPVHQLLHQIVDLCSDPSLLGWELLNSAHLRLGHSHGGRRDVSALKIVIELLIQAHEYFTASCCMEGIAAVLRKSKNLANTLQHLKLWSLLVRLVTGVGRFTEMNYIFQIFKEHHQFEFLLGKGMDKVPGLKTALLEFCKKQCPEDRELFNLVTLHFQLNNEIGMKWETEAKSCIRELIKKSRKENIKLPNTMQSAIKLSRNDKTEESLQLAMANFTHATDYFLQDNKLNLANRCARQAQLVALQLARINGVSYNQEVTCLLDLTSDEVYRVLCQDLTFAQTLILVEAYNHNADWPNILYHHVIINGQTRFLKDFLAYKRLTPAIVQDCACRYRTEKNISKQMTINMQHLITELNDIECKYVLASQLGFKDIIESMLSDATTGAYLKDTVWKKGFNPQQFIGESFHR